jgi:hypothetical protein
VFSPLGCRLRVGIPLGLVDRAEVGREDDAAFEGLEWRIPSIGALVVAAAIDAPGSPPPGVPKIAPLLATFRYSRFITLCLGVVGELVGSSGTFRACGPVYVLIGRGRTGGWIRDAEEEEEADDAEVVEITDAFRESSELDGALTMILVMGVDIHKVQLLTDLYDFLRISRGHNEGRVAVQVIHHVGSQPPQRLIRQSRALHQN